jgi:uncharacterized phage-associated protein
MRAMDVANYFLSLVDEEVGDSLTNLKLQKLVYYAQGFSLVIQGRPLFEETIEAWEHGPVVPSLYRHFKRFQANSIPRPVDFDPGCFDAAEQDLLNEVFKVYGQFSASKLRNMTHEEPPWADAYRERPSTVIDHGAMKTYFSTLVNGR